MPSDNKITLTTSQYRPFTITADMIDSARFNYDNYCQTLYGQPINTITTVWNIDEEEKVKLEKDNICLREKVKELEEEIKLLKSGAK